MQNPDRALEPFHPLVQAWFVKRLGRPTDIQAKAWPIIAQGRHCLVTAPTGSGKTLTAFLWALNQLITGVWATGRPRVLYVSPLKALGNDIRRNLIAPLGELALAFKAAGEPFPHIGVLTRSGDTPADERRKMSKHPPEILITTPESLNILLSSASGEAMLGGIVTVILDEIHAVTATKRGTHLITAVERLTRLAGEFQRLALSATVKPLSAVADFMAGYRLTGQDGGYEKRSVVVIQGADEKRLDIRVSFPPEAREQMVDDSRWPALAAAFRPIIKASAATLLFVNSRRTAERLTRLINADEPTELAYAHHGSLAREIRLAVEQKLKKGELKAIVATSSLELGIDIGELEKVILVQTPPSIAAAIQRIGRAGHRVGGISRGLIYPTHGLDFLTAAVLARAVMEQDIESMKPITAPLDVLAQVILSMAGRECWDIDELFAFIRTCEPYHELKRSQFDLVLDMLAGRYADTRLRELKPRISLDKVEGTVQAKEGAQRLIYLSGGTIPERGYFDLRLEGTRAKIGELDEEFVWERRIGDTFPLGAQVWRIQRITSNDVEVAPSAAKPGILPFWRAEDQNRDFHFAHKILIFLQEYTARLDDPDLGAELKRNYCLDQTAAVELIEFLGRQRHATGSELPHRRHIIVEYLGEAAQASDKHQVILHTLWGGRVNKPFSLALQAAWEEKFHTLIETITSNEGILLILPFPVSAAEIFALVSPENLERLLRSSLESSGFFGARFRENAGRALLLPRADFKRRLPLWLNRLRAKQLMEAVLKYPDFPILLETWRTCLKDEFDLANLATLLDEIRTGGIALSEARTTLASPLAEGLIWKQTNTFMYSDDTPSSGKASSLSRELLKEIVSSSSLRPRIPESLVTALEDKLKRTAPGYAPRFSIDLLDWVKERLLIPEPEWQALLEAVTRDHGPDAVQATAPIHDKLVTLTLPGAGRPVVCALEDRGRITQAFGLESDSPETKTQIDEALLADILLQWLSFYGPLELRVIQEALGISASTLNDLLSGLAEDQAVAIDLLSEHANETQVCERENLEILLRMARAARRPVFKALAIERLPLYLAAWQGLTAPGETVEDLQARLDQLFGYPALAELWEGQILPARLNPYYSSWLDGLLQTSDLAWFGCGKGRLGFAFREDLELYLSGTVCETSMQDCPEELARLFPREGGRYSLLEIMQFTHKDSAGLTRALWDLLWQGRVSNDSFAALRQGILTRFAPVTPRDDHRRTARTSRSRWSMPKPFPGHWYALAIPDQEVDPLVQMELAKDRVRQLLRRYGILFRELLAHEQTSLQWGAVFKALRLMELSGEIISGHFFEAIPGLQFMSYEAFRFLSASLPEDAVYWMNACDPASLCGVQLEGLKTKLPSRTPTTFLVYRGATLVLVARQGGRTLHFHTPPDDPRMAEYLAFFKTLLGREFNPLKIITVETINGEPALESTYAPILRSFGFTGYHKGLELVKKYP
ncbi:MAG: DEAD/DEAH box helicase [Syntrophaceae bacterium]